MFRRKNWAIQRSAELFITRTITRTITLTLPQIKRENDEQLRLEGIVRSQQEQAAAIELVRKRTEDVQQVRYVGR